MHWRRLVPRLAAVPVVGLTALALATEDRGAARAKTAQIEKAPPARVAQKARAQRAPARPARPKQPSIRITKIGTNTGGVAAEGLLPFCSTDTLRLVSRTHDADGLNIRWQIQAMEGAVKTARVSPDGKKYEFRLVGLEAWPDPYSPRMPLSFEVSAALVDGKGKQVASDFGTITQSDLGQLRQEYVDHPLLPPAGVKRVPNVTAFRAIPRDGQWNDGDYDWALVPDWTLATNELIQRQAVAEGVVPAGIRINSCYRNPVRHWALYYELGRRVTPGSRHMWGLAVDYQVADTDGDQQTQTWSDYGMVRDVCADHARVIPEGRTDHVHIQWMPG